MKRTVLTDTLIFFAGIVTGIAIHKRYIEWMESTIKPRTTVERKPVQCIGVLSKKPTGDPNVIDTVPKAQPETNTLNDPRPEPVEKPQIHVITPEEYASSDYVAEELTYFERDDILLDAFSQEADREELFPGIDIQSHFGEYEDDSVYIRNEDLELDYAIIKDFRNYADVKAFTPHDITDEE